MFSFWVIPLFAEPHAYPVPFVAKKHQKIYFNELPGAGEIKIFTVSGEEVARIPVSASEGGQKEWTVTNSSGEKVATGVYLFLVDAGGQKFTGKLVVIR